MSFIKTRHLRLYAVADAETLRRLVTEEIETIPGVISVEINATTNTLEVTYDVRQTNLDAIEGTLERFGLSVRRNWMQRISRGLVRFMEENERDNALAPASPCCSHPDALLQKAKHNHSSL